MLSSLCRRTAVVCGATISVHLLSSTNACDQTGSAKAEQKKVPSARIKMPKTDCPDPVCQSTSDMFAQALKGASKSTDPTKAAAKAKAPARCPLDINELGKSAWDVIHTMAAYYPEDPSEEQQRAATNFFTSLALLYPCHICAEDFQESVGRNPPRVASRAELMMWCCELHNEVNIKLGKQAVACDMTQMTKMWRTGSAGCAINVIEVDDESS